jgi:bifunctional non-homologous end joining protein LigD
VIEPGLLAQFEVAFEQPDVLGGGLGRGDAVRVFLGAEVAKFVAEVRWDGLRACIAVAGGRVRAWSRNDRDITAAYPELGALAAVAGRRRLVLDGEIVALAGPRPDFTLLQRRMRSSRPGAGLVAPVPVTLIIFDMLRSGREDLVGSPYALRRALLEDLGLEVHGSVQVPPVFPGEAAALLAATRDQDLEGIALKRPASLYHPGRRTREWLKIRNIRAAEVRVGGWLPSTGARRNMAGSVLMGLPRPVAQEFAGTAGSGLSELRELTALLQSVEQPVSPFAGPLPAEITRQARPVFAAEVTYLERTPVRTAAPAGVARPEAGLAAARGQTLTLTGVTAGERTTVSLRGGHRAPDVPMVAR